jgi:hypothetical protein
MVLPLTEGEAMTTEVIGKAFDCDVIGANQKDAGDEIDHGRGISPVRSATNTLRSAQVRLIS